jgi:hypothetical protein
MRRWSFWEWVAYFALLVGALIMAAETGFKTEPEVMERLPAFFHSWLWGFSPAILVIVATIILILREFVFTNRTAHEGPLASFAQSITSPEAPNPLNVARVFVSDSITPKYLAELYNHNTAIQVNGITRNYIGKWMRLSGILSQVLSSVPTRAQLTFENGDFNKVSDYNYYSVFMYFKSPFVDRLTTLRKGDSLTIIGQISEIIPLALSLDNCEIILPPTTPTH